MILTPTEQEVHDAVIDQLAKLNGQEQHTLIAALAIHWLLRQDKKKREQLLALHVQAIRHILKNVGELDDLGEPEVH